MMIYWATLDGFFIDKDEKRILLLNKMAIGILWNIPFFIGEGLYF